MLERVLEKGTGGSLWGKGVGGTGRGGGGVFLGSRGRVAVRTGCEEQGGLQRCCGGSLWGCRGRMEPTGGMKGKGTSGGAFSEKGRPGVRSGHTGHGGHTAPVP